ncbi:hypothetical protein ACVW00_001446 [Marmoricola sp. URHA0025 HA25]
MTLGVWFAATRSRHRVPGPVVTGAVVLGTVTLVAIPVLGRFGARADNPTLLDRNYLLGWLVVATLTVVLVGAALAVARSGRAGGGGERGAGSGRR